MSQTILNPGLIALRLTSTVTLIPTGLFPFFITELVAVFLSGTVSRRLSYSVTGAISLSITTGLTGSSSKLIENVPAGDQ
jgi:hypothetical protein